MKQLFTLTVCILSGLFSSAQSTIIRFDNKGLIDSGLLNDKEYNKKESIILKTPLLTEEMLKIKNGLIKRIDKSIRVLSDTNRDVTKLYMLLWDSVTYKKVREELINLKNCLEENSQCKAPYDYRFLPSDAELKKSFINTDLYEINTNKFTSETTIRIAGFIDEIEKNKANIDLIVTDPFKQWLINHFNSTVKSASYYHFDIDDMSAYWKSLQTYAGRISDLLKKLQSMPSDRCDSLFVKNAMQFHNSLINEPIVSMLRTDTLFKRWIWYTQGAPLFNPLGITSEEKHWINTGATDAEKAEAAKRIQEDKLKLKELATVSRKVYQIQLPIEKDKKKNVTTIYLNAANKYKADPDLIKKNIPEGDVQQFLVYNIPGTSEILMTETASAIPDESAAQKDFNNFFKPITEALKELSGITAPYSYFPVNPLVPYLSFTEPDIVKTKEDEESMNISKDKIIIIKEPVVSNLLFSKLSPDQRITVKNGKSYIGTFLKNRKIPWGTQMKGDAYIILINKLLSELASEINCQQNFLKLRTLLPSDSVIITILLKFTPMQRDLPPDSVKAENLLSVPVLYSRLLIPGTGDAPEKIDYTIIEKSLKVGSDKDSVTKAVHKGSFNRGKQHRFQISAGVTWTTNEFDHFKAENKDGKLTVSNDNDRIRFTAGLHFYPWRDYLLDNRFIINGFSSHLKERTSFYLGLGIPKVWENYYFGIGVDLWPGFKLHGGMQNILNTKYKIVNNQIMDRADGLKRAGGYIGFNISTSSLATLLGLFKKS